MTVLLHVSASERGDRSHSRRAGEQLVEGIVRTEAGMRVIRRDLACDAPPHLDRQFIDASLMPPQARDAQAKAALAYSEVLIGELEACDLLVIDTPMHNFTVPSTLKAWIDHVLRPGRTFQVGASGKLGLLRDRPVLLVVASGGAISGTRYAQHDFLVPYLRYALSCIGLNQVDSCHLERLHAGPESTESATRHASQWIDQQVAAWRHRTSATR